MEIFTFVYMGGGIDRITFVPLTKQSKDTSSGDVMKTSAEERQRERARLLAKYAGRQAQRSDNRSARAALNDIVRALERRQKALMKGYKRRPAWSAEAEVKALVRRVEQAHKH